MFLKIISKFFRPIGISFIFLFSLFCILNRLRSFEHGTDSILSNFLDYTYSFESRFYDYRIKKRLDQNERSKEITLIKIDDFSLEEIGTWPIPRNLHAKMIRNLKHFGAKVVAMDILYPEKAPVCGGYSPDKELATAMQDFKTEGRDIFIAYAASPEDKKTFQMQQKSNKPGELPTNLLDFLINVTTSAEKKMTPYSVNWHAFPIEELVESGVGLANISNEEDPDGIFRHYPLVLTIDEFQFSSLGYYAWKSFINVPHSIEFTKFNNGELKIDDELLEFNNRGEAKVRYIGGLDHFTNISLQDLLNAKDDDKTMFKKISGKIVFVGSTAMGAHDLRSSPIDAKMPGVLSHMNFTNMLLKKYFFKPIFDSVIYSMIILVFGMMVFIYIQTLENAFLDFVVINLLLTATYFIDYYFFLPKGYEITLFYCFFCFILSYSWNTFLKFFDASQEKKQVRETFARYVAPTIVDEMLKDPQKLHIGGFKRDITCLFSDVRDFTSISEGLSAAELAQSLNMYMGKMTDIVFDTKGTLDKYIGDAIVAFWGAPLEIGNHAQQAVEGAIKMIELLPLINQEFRKLGRPEFYVGIGLNSGECNVGNMGSDRIFSYTALGDNMNLGARLEGLCKYYGTQILISEHTLSRIDQTKIKIRPIDNVIVKGKTTPVGVFEVLHANHFMTKDAENLALYLTAWGQFQKRNFASAMVVFNQILVNYKTDVPTLRLKELCQKYLDNPELIDDNFNITKMTEK